MAKTQLAQLEAVFERAVQLVEPTHSFDAAASQLLELFGSALQCDWGTYWKVEGIVLVPKVTWSAPGVQARELEEDLRSRTLSSSEGTAGHVWRSRKPVLSVDIISDLCLPRSLKAERAGLHGGVWFALKTDRYVYGVIELLGRSLSPSSDELISGIEAVGMKFGRLIESQTEGH